MRITIFDDETNTLFENTEITKENIKKLISIISRCMQETQQI